jgi:hypothetical protein
MEMLRTADGQPIQLGQTVYQDPRNNLQAIPSGRAGEVIELKPDIFADGIVLVHWGGSRMVAIRLANRSGQWRTEVHQFDISVQAMRPSELLSSPKALGRLV